MIDGSSPTPTGDIDRENPWPGLSSFTEATQGFFFGRDRETDELSRLVRRETLTVLFGQSGLGKSSLLQAGLFPILRESDHLPLYLRLDHSSPIGNRQSEIGNAGAAPLAEQVKSALNDAFATAKADAPRLGPEESLWEYFHRKDVDIWSAKNRLLTPVLAFDQFEEMFTLGRADEPRRERSRAFLTELADLVENRAPAALKAQFENGTADPARYNFDKPSCRVILSLREDFLPDLEGLKQELPALIHNRLRLKRLNGAQALEAVTRPAPHLLAEGVGEKIVEFVSGARGGSAERLLEMEVEPALLSVICRELNERRRTLGQAQITPDLVSGNRREILNDFYERSVADLPEAMRIFVEDHLLTKSGFRDNLALETALEYRGVTRPLVDILVARRLLRVEERAGIQRVELTHDVLADVVRASRDSRQQRLAVADAGRRTRRMRYAIAGLVAAVVALSVGAVFGIRAQRRAADQAARVDLATGSRLLDEGKVGDGLAYLVSAAQRDHATGVAATRILTTLTSHNFSLPVGAALRLPSPAGVVRFMAGGRSALILSEDGSLRLIDVAGWKIVREYRFDHKIDDAGLRIAKDNPDLFAVALVNGTIVVCDTATGRVRFAPIVPPARVDSLNRQRQNEKPAWLPNFALSPDGRWLRTINDSWAVFDAATGAERSAGDLFHVTMDYDPVSTPFSPDGTRLVISNSQEASRNAAGEISTTNTSIQLRSVPDGKLVAAFPGDSRIYGNYGQGTMFSADGKRLLILGWLPSAAGPALPAAYVRDLDALALVGPPIPFSKQRFNQIWLTPDGKRIVIASDDRTTNVYDVATGQPAFPALRHNGPVSLAGISDDSTILATVSVDGLCRLWNLRTGNLAVESTYRQDRPSPAALSPDGQTLLITTASGLVHRMQITLGAAASLELPRPVGLSPLVQFAAKPPARLLWFEPWRARMLDIVSGRWTEGGFDLPFPVGTSAAALVLGPTEDTLHPGDAIVARRPQGAPRAWLMGENGVSQNVGFADSVPANAVFVLSANGKYGAAPIEATAPTEPRGLGIWDLHTGRRVATIGGLAFPTGNQSLFLNLSGFSPDNQRIAAYEPRTDGASEGIRVYEIGGAKLLFKVTAEEKAPFSAARFSPDGTHLLTGNAWGNVQVWDGKTGKLLQSNQAHAFTVSRFVFSGDGRLYASLSQDGTVQVWDSATDKPVGAALVHGDAVIRASFSPDNKRIATAAISGSARIWDVRSGLPVSDPLDHNGAPVTLADYSPDGRFMMTFAGAGTTSPAQRVWAAPPTGRVGRAPEWLLQLATICAGRRLNEEGKLVSAADEFDRFDELRRKIATLPSDDPYAEWARWFLSDSLTRPIAPGFTITPVEAKKLTDEMSAPDPLIAWTARDNALLLANKVGSEPLERQMVAWSLQRDGEGGFLHADHLIKLAQTLLVVGKFEEAESLARSSLALREKLNFGGGIMSARATIGAALVGQKRYAEAEPLLVEGCEFFKQSGATGGLADLPGIQAQHRVDSLVQLYEATGRPEKAAQWKQWSPRSAGAPASATPATTPPPAAPTTAPKP